MSKRKRKDFLKDLHVLMERIPDDLTFEELQLAVREAGIALGCKYFCELSRREFIRHTEGAGTR
jgi:hypothetical protein